MSEQLHQEKDKKRLPKITDEEKQLMQKWLQKDHVGHNQLNARWIKGGGGVGMKMTESKTVKTSGAYESLAKYVNERLESKPKPSDDAFWTPKIASTRFAAAFKAYSEASKMGNKSDSAIGASEEEVNHRQVNYNAVLLAQQVKKCPMYVVFNALYSEHPSVNPVISVGMTKDNMHVGNIGDAGDGDNGSRNEDEVDEESDKEDKEEQPQGTPNKSSKSSTKSGNSNTGDTSATKAKSKKDKGSFKLKEGAKKADFTTVWATTMAEAKEAKLKFEMRKEEREIEERKRDREDREKDRNIQAKKIRSDLLFSLVDRGLTEDQIKRYMRLAGHYDEDESNFTRQPSLSRPSTNDHAP